MANVYVDENAGGAGTGADWTNAYLTLSAALAAKAAGDVFYVAHDHAETTGGAVTLTSPGTTANPCQIICVNKAGSVPPVSADIATTATVTVTGANNLTLAGVVSLCYGITFTVGDSTNNVAFLGGGQWTLDTCAVRNSGNAAGSIRPSTTFLKTTWRNTTVQFAHIGQSITSMVGGKWEWLGGSITGATFPTNLFGGSNYGTAIVRGVDLANMSTKTLLAAAAGAFNLHFEDCKLPASFTRMGTPSVYAPRLTLARCDSGATNYRNEAEDYLGAQTIETTIVRTGGASDGTTSIAWKLVSTTARFSAPFESLPIAIWNSTAGSVTVTAYGIWGGGAVPDNDDIWMEVTYLDDSGFPVASVASTAKADILATATSHTADGSTWGGSTTAFKMATTITPALVGTMFIRFKVGGSNTFYMDPKIELS
jgi:hypothetical protein